MNTERWNHLIDTINREVGQLNPEIRSTTLQVLDLIAVIQDRMHNIFLEGGGEEECIDCKGYCCDRGLNYPTLVTLLQYLLRGESFPQPDFSRGCPYLHGYSCSMPPGRRPYNCVTFACERVDLKMSEELRTEFYGLDQELRRLYALLGRRFAGATMHGIVITEESLKGAPFLGEPHS